MLLTPKEFSEIEQMIDTLWSMYDDAEKAGEESEASALAVRAFALADRLPKNCVYLTQH